MTKSRDFQLTPVRGTRTARTRVNWWRAAIDEPARDETTANLKDVVRIAGQVFLEKGFLGTNPSNDRETKRTRGNHRQPRSDGERASRNRNQHCQIARVP